MQLQWKKYQPTNEKKNYSQPKSEIFKNINISWVFNGSKIRRHKIRKVCIVKENS